MLILNIVKRNNIKHSNNIFPKNNSTNSNTTSNKILSLKVHKTFIEETKEGKEIITSTHQREESLSNVFNHLLMSTVTISDKRRKFNERIGHKKSET